VKFQQCSKFGEQQTRMESTQAFFENLNEEAMASGHDINDILLHCRFNQQKCNANNCSVVQFPYGCDSLVLITAFKPMEEENPGGISKP
jgi:hypothetical protein